MRQGWLKKQLDNAKKLVESLPAWMTGRGKDTMYTKEDVKSLCDLFEQYQQAQDNLESFCRKVVRAFNYDDVSNINIVDGDVSFTAEWYGPCQSHDSENFIFPASLLVEGEEGVIEYLQRLRKQKQDAQKAKQEARKEQEERQLLATLKEKYENGT